MASSLTDMYGSLHSNIREILDASQKSNNKVPLAVPPFSYDDYVAAIDTLLSGSLSMGERVKSFESTFANYLGCKNPGVMVNSGSSANLLSLSILTNGSLKERLKPGDEIITPAVTWATTVFPISMIGAKPVLVDIDKDSYNIDVNQIKKAITKKTKAIMPVHLLGNPCKIDEIKEMADANDLFLIEDCCEAHGAELNGKKVGTFGDLATFSFFISHHISTIEGGMILSNNDRYYELGKALRAFGWIRELRDKEKLAKKHSSIDPRFLFVTAGFNVRPTEMQGALGMTQLPKLENIIKTRRDNAKYWNERLSKYEKFISLPVENDGARHVYFCYPISLKPRAPFKQRELVSFLEQKGIETRPVMTGNIVRQPALAQMRYRSVGKLPNADYVTKNAFLIGNHTGVTEKVRDYVADTFEEFFSRYN